jgi:hypothetical protein
MTERPNDAPDGPTEEPGAEPPTDDETMDLGEEGALEPGGPAEDFDEATASAPEAPASQDEVAAKAAEAEVHRERGLRPSERRAARAAEHAQIPIDHSLQIKDRASALFVLLVIVVFGLIALNGLVLGKGGALTAVPTLGPLATPGVTLSPTTGPTPVVTLTPILTPTAGPTAAP